MTTEEQHVSRPYQYSVSLDCNAKGWIQPSIKVMSDTLVMNKNSSTIEEVAILLLDNTVNFLKKQGYKVATDIEEIPKNGS
jgi:hypothetical protein